MDQIPSPSCSVKMAFQKFFPLTPASSDFLSLLNYFHYLTNSNCCHLKTKLKKNPNKLHPNPLPDNTAFLCILIQQSFLKMLSKFHAPNSSSCIPFWILSSEVLDPTTQPRLLLSRSLHIAKSHFPSSSAAFSNFLPRTLFLHWASRIFLVFLLPFQSPLLILPNLFDLRTLELSGLAAGSLLCSISLTAFFAAFIQSHSFKHRLSADISQIPSWTPLQLLSHISNCTSTSPLGCFKLCIHKTEFWFSSEYSSFQLLLAKSSKLKTLESSSTALSCTSLIWSINKSYWFYLQNIPRIWLCLTTAIINTQDRATIISHLDSWKIQQVSMLLLLFLHHLYSKWSKWIKVILLKQRWGQVSPLLKIPSLSSKGLLSNNFPTHSGYNPLVYNGL